MSSIYRLIGFAFLLLVPVTASAVSPWTGTPSTAAVDEASLGIFQVDTSSLGYNASGSVAAIVARLNVTDTTATGFPGWTTLEIRTYDPGPNSQVRAQLARVTAGGLSFIASCTSSDNALISTWQCPLLGSVDFNAGFLYVVVISITRTTNAVSPFITGVRIF